MRMEEEGAGIVQRDAVGEAPAGLDHGLRQGRHAVILVRHADAVEMHGRGFGQVIVEGELDLLAALRPDQAEQLAIIGYRCAWPACRGRAGAGPSRRPTAPRCAEAAVAGSTRASLVREGASTEPVPSAAPARRKARRESIAPPRFIMSSLRDLGQGRRGCRSPRP